MLSDLAQAVRRQAREAGMKLEDLREGILALQLAMGEGGNSDLSAEGPLALLNDCYTRIAKMCMAVSGTEDEKGKTLKRGLEDDVHSATTWILGEENQPKLPGTIANVTITPEGAERIKEMCDRLLAETDITIPGSAMPTIREGSDYLKGDDADGDD